MQTDRKEVSLRQRSHVCAHVMWRTPQTRGPTSAGQNQVEVNVIKQKAKMDQDSTWIHPKQGY